MRSLPSRVLAAALAGVMAACTGGGAPSLPAATASPTIRPPSAPTPQPSPTRATASAAPSTPASAPIRIPLSGAAPDAIALDGGTAWVLAGEGGALMQVDLAGGREVRAFDVGFGATHLVLLRPGMAAVARFDDSEPGAFLQVVDLATGSVESVPTQALGGLAGGERGVVWALEKGGRLLKVDVAARRVLGETPVEIGQNVHTEVQWGAGSAWVGSDGTPVLRVAADLTKVDTIQVDTGLPFLVRGGLVWGAGPEQVWAVDPATNVVVRRVPLQNVTEVLALDIAGQEAWLAVRRPGDFGAAIEVDLATGAVRSEFRVSLPAAVRIADDRVWVASYLTNELLGFQR
jgi:hypothetical protein